MKLRNPIFTTSFASLFAFSAHAASVTASVSGLSSDDGAVTFCLWASSDGFPNCDGDAPSAKVTSSASGGSASATFENVKPGAYAVSAFQDLDGDGKIKKRLGRIPTEPVAATVAEKPRLGPPSYDKATFDVADDDIEVNLLLLN